MKFAIIGTGVMGRGWITQCTMTGHEVHCHDNNPDTLSGVVGTLDAAARINEHVEAIAQGHVGAKDWAAMAGLRVRW